MNQKLKQKITESLSAVLPITLIVGILCVTITPMPAETLLLFLIGATMLIFGMGFFTLGAETAMMPIGERIGRRLAKSSHLCSIVLMCFFLGAVITVAEPDLQILANQTPAVPDMVLILSVACGVGVFLVVSFLRNLFGWSLSRILVGCYAVMFVLACFVPREFQTVAFDSGGVTTGPITVPFIMALGLGLATVRKQGTSGGDSFGLIALCSIGPVLAVLILGLAYDTPAAPDSTFIMPAVSDTRDLSLQFGRELPVYLKEVTMALLPIVVLFLLFHLISLHLRWRQLAKILIGMLYSFVGLTLFLTGVNVGFMPVGNYLGAELASLSFRWVIIPIGMLIGFFIVKAEPAVLVLNKQVEDVTEGMISQKTMMTGLCIGMALSVGLSMVRVLTGVPLFWFLLGGYGIALALSFVVPSIFTAIAFDSGGVASGPMTATFLLPFAMGACRALGGNIMTDAFGVVAMVAMTPLIVIQMIGLVFQLKSRRSVPILEEAAGNEIISFEEDLSDAH